MVKPTQPDALEHAAATVLTSVDLFIYNIGGNDPLQYVSLNRVYPDSADGAGAGAEVPQLNLSPLQKYPN